MSNQPSYASPPGDGPQGGPQRPAPRQRSALWYLAWIFGSFAALVVLLALVISFVYVKGQVARQKAIEGQLNSLNSDKEELDRKLRSATTPEERERLEQEIAAKQSAIEGLKTNQPAPTAKPAATFRGNTGGPAPKPTGPKCNCKPGDPLCSCL